MGAIMVSIPSGIFTKYAEIADAMLDLSGFGTQCQLVYTDKIEEISDDIPDYKRKRIFDIQTISPDSGFKRGDKKFRTVETTENIVLRVYWDERDFKKFGNISMPDGSVMAIGNYSDLAKIRKAAFLLIETAKTNHAPWKFEKAAEPTVHGLDSNYLMSYWKRV
jgi:hypothetical protein